MTPMTIELQTIFIGVVANIVGDQIIFMLLTGALHLCGRKCARVAARVRDDAGMAAPQESMSFPGNESLLPIDAT